VQESDDGSGRPNGRMFEVGSRKVEDGRQMIPGRSQAGGKNATGLGRERTDRRGRRRQCIADVPASWCMSPARSARVDGRATAPAVGPLGPYRNPLMGRIPDVSSETDWIGCMPPGRAPNRKGRQAAERDPCRLPSLSCAHTMETTRTGNRACYPDSGLPEKGIH
jgi:hypothetical protein